MRLKRFVVLISASILAASALAVAAQSLGDIAKKEEERRKKVPQPGKVYTNKDLGSPTSETPPPPATAPASDAKPADKKDAKDAAADKDKDKDKDKESPKDQKYWADRKKSLQDQLDRDQTYADALQSRINALTTDFVNRADPAQRAVIERDRQKALGELNRLKNQIVADKKALVDLDEEARRAGVPPGWLR
jgi:hypothetical protein